MALMFLITGIWGTLGSIVLIKNKKLKELEKELVILNR